MAPKTLLRQIARTKNLITIDLEGPGIEVKPGRFSPIYINMKCLWSRPELLQQVCDQLSKRCRPCAYTVGIETGGAPLATLVAAKLQIPLFLARKNSQRKKLLAGAFFDLTGPAVIIDDVLATGLSMNRALKRIKKTSEKASVAIILSYGMDKMIESKFKVKVISLYQIEDVLSILPEKQSKALLPHIRAYQRKLKSIIQTL
jgi:orotate phosphoribosyltransferase